MDGEKYAINLQAIKIYLSIVVIILSRLLLKESRIFRD